MDLSKFSTASLLRGLGLLDTFPGEAPEVRLLHVLPPEDAVAPESVATEELAQAVGAELEALAKRIDPEGRRRIDTRLEIGGPRRGILAHLAREPSDLVIIGSVAEAIARRAPTSVLLVPPGDSVEAAQVEPVPVDETTK